jgi:hypothetical protein
MAPRCSRKRGVLELNYSINLETYTIHHDYSVGRCRFEGVKYVSAVSAHKNKYQHPHGSFRLIEATFWKSAVSVWVTPVVIPATWNPSTYLKMLANHIYRRGGGKDPLKCYYTESRRQFLQGMDVPCMQIRGFNLFVGNYYDHDSVVVSLNRTVAPSMIMGGEEN